MKKNFYTLITLLLAASLALAGCGAEEETAVEETVAAATEAVVEETTEATAPAGKDVVLGTYTDHVYENAYAGFGAELDDGWTVATSEQLQDLPAEITELLKGTEVGETAQKYSQIMDIQAQSNELMANFNVLYTELSTAERIAYALQNEDSVADMILSQKDVLVSSYDQVGIEVSSIEKTNVTFLGQEHVAVKTVGTTQGMDVYIVQVFNYQLGRYAVTATFSTFVEDSTQEILDLFYEVA